MLHVLLILGWLLAVACMLLLVVETVRARLLKKPAKPKVRKRRFWQSHWFAEDEVSPTPLGTPPPTQGDFSVRPWLKPAAIVAFLLWEVFWISEIVEKTSQSDRPLQLPYVFLLVVMIGIPTAIYFAARKWLPATPDDI